MKQAEVYRFYVLLTVAASVIGYTRSNDSNKMKNGFLGALAGLAISGALYTKFKDRIDY